VASVRMEAVAAMRRLAHPPGGVVFAPRLAGMALACIGVGLRGHRVLRRRLYTALLLLMGAAGAIYAVTAWQGGEPSNICDEHTELKWFSVSEMRGLGNIVDPDYVSFAELAMTDKPT